MSLEKAIASGKEHRKPFRRSQRWDITCRCHGACGYCRGNRLISTVRQQQKANISLIEEGLAPRKSNALPRAYCESQFWNI